MTEAEWQRLAAGFQTYDLLDAVDRFDEVRYAVGDDEDGRPPETRTDLLTLHTLAMAVVNEGQQSKARQLFDLAQDINLEISNLLVKLEQVQDVLDRLTQFAPPFQEDEA